MVKKTIAIFSAVLWVLLPKCSLCLFAYMGIFSAIGLANLVYNPYTVIFMSIFLIVNFVTVLFMLLKEKEYHYATLSFVAAIVLVCNKLYMHNNLYINALITGILVFALIRVRLLNTLSKRCVFYGRLGKALD